MQTLDIEISHLFFGRISNEIPNFSSRLNDPLSDQIVYFTQAFRDLHFPKI